MKREPPRMRPADLAGMAVSALGQQKGRTALTVLGVAIGTFALFVSLSIGHGVDRAILSLFRGTDALRQISLYVHYEAVAEDVPEPEKAVTGTMSEAKRVRLHHALIRTWGVHNVSKPKARLDRAGLDRLARLAHVERVVPVVYQQGTIALGGIEPPHEARFASADPDGHYRSRLVAGRALAGDGVGEAIVHEFLLYNLGFVGDDEVGKAIGRKIRFEYRVSRGGKLTLARLLTFGEMAFTPTQSESLIRLLRRLAPWVRLLPIPAEERAVFSKLVELTPTESDPMEEDCYAETFTVVGVVRETLDEDENNNTMLMPWVARGADVILPPWTAAEFSLRTPLVAQSGLNQVVLTVDRDANVKQVAKAVESMGFKQSSMIQVIETIRMNVLLITVATAFIAVVALTVAAIGITNTMLMSVLERTHEIGIMKALGARTSQVRMIFLIEGASIGLVGGGLGLLLGWIASFPGDAIARSIMQAQSPKPIEGSLFAFPIWLVLGTQILATLITMLAALYPAHRAARMDPIISLRHE
jgi:putative ABC transport system permease protein